MAVDAYDRITARIIDQLETGTVPWHRPWRGGESGHPRNLASGHRYRGVNVFLLSCSGYDSPHWLTFRQAKKLGGHVRRGESSTPVVFWKWIERENPETGKVDRFPLLRQYAAFNVEQCELPAEKLPSALAEAERDFEPIAVCDQVVVGMPSPPDIHHGGGAAVYRPADDSVHMPRQGRFDTSANYYATLFHELIHSTGHESRLNRPGVTGEIRFGSRDYSREELVAEMGAAFLCGHCGIENSVIENSAAYIAGWLRKLRNDTRLVVHAAAAAQKAADWVLGNSHSNGKSEERDGE